MHHLLTVLHGKVVNPPSERREDAAREEEQSPRNSLSPLSLLCVRSFLIPRFFVPPVAPIVCQMCVPTPLPSSCM